MGGGSAQVTPHYLRTPLDALRVEDAMHDGIFTCDRETPLSEVARTMVREVVHCVIVESGSGESGPVWGVVSNLDLVAAANRHVDVRVVVDLEGRGGRGEPLEPAAGGAVDVGAEVGGGDIDLGWTNPGRGLEDCIAERPGEDLVQQLLAKLAGRELLAACLENGFAGAQLQPGFSRLGQTLVQRFARHPAAFENMLARLGLTREVQGDT